jgi:hypothetical protein
MVMKCNKCGWRGINLKPDVENDQALCPSCGVPFAGLTAKDANIMSSEEEKDIMNHCII